MKTKLQDENQILALVDGVLVIRGKTVMKEGRKVTHPDRAVKGMVEEAFRKEVKGDYPSEVHLSIGKGFRWDIEFEEVVSFDEVILDMMDEGDFAFNERGELTARVQLSATY